MRAMLPWSWSWSSSRRRFHVVFGGIFQFCDKWGVQVPTRSSRIIPPVGPRPAFLGLFQLSRPTRAGVSPQTAPNNFKSLAVLYNFGFVVVVPERFPAVAGRNRWFILRLARQPPRGSFAARGTEWSSIINTFPGAHTGESTQIDYPRWPVVGHVMKTRAPGINRAKIMNTFSERFIRRRASEEKISFRKKRKKRAELLAMTPSMTHRS